MGGTDREGSREVIARAASILRTLENAPTGLTIAEITRGSGLPRTTVARLVASLQAEQLVASIEGTIRLGPVLVRLAAAVRLDAIAVARPHMEALSRSVRETVDLWVEREAEVELIYEVASDQEVRIVATSGFRLPLGTTAPGKALLARLDNDEIKNKMVGRLQARTSGSVPRLQALLRDIETTRRTGIAQDIEEHADDVCAVAMMVDLGLVEQYVIAIPAPVRRFRETRERLEIALRECVQAIEARR